MKRLFILSLGAALTAGSCAPYVYVPPGPPPPPVPVVTIAVGDRPYYTRGPYYYHRSRRYVWVNGHWARRYGNRVWVHGHYVVR